MRMIAIHVCAQTDSIWGIAWTEADRVISTSADGSIRQWTSAGEPLAPSPNRGFPEAHTLGLTSLSVAPDGRAALFNSIEGLTCLWDLVSGDITGKFESYNRSAGDDIEPSWTVSLNPRGETYASAGASGNVTIHSATPGEDFGRRWGHGKRVALSSESGQIYIFDLESESLTKTFTSHAMSVRDLAWSPDGNLLISASEDKRLRWEIASFTGHSSWVLSVDISPDSRLCLSGSADKTIKVWDIGARAAVSTVQENGEVWSVSWRPKGAGAFVSGGEDGVVRWWRGAGAAASTF
ncbi:WD repeat-containing protein 61 [Mucidula mucida]|nr:WD repeat-containing protein 61 [Mucidula mucida]